MQKASLGEMAEVTEGCEIRSNYQWAEERRQACKYGGGVAPAVVLLLITKAAVAN